MLTDLNARYAWLTKPMVIKQYHNVPHFRDQLFIIASLLEILMAFVLFTIYNYLTASLYMLEAFKA